MFDIPSFAAGFLFATTLGIIAQRIRQLGGAIGGPGRPYDMFPDAIQPNTTATGVVARARAARIRRLFLQILFIAVFGGGIALIGQWIADTGISALGRGICF
jgi:hypothetical protein